MVRFLLCKQALASQICRHQLCAEWRRAHRTTAEIITYLVPREQRQGLLYLGSVVHREACEEHDAEAWQESTRW